MDERGYRPGRSQSESASFGQSPDCEQTAQDGHPVSASIEETIMYVASAGEPNLLGDAIVQLVGTKPKPFFLQIEGFDGVSFDPLRQQIVDKALSGIIVEPVPQHFEKLKALYVGSTNITTVNCAIGPEDGERTIWRFNPKAIEHGLLPPHFAGI